MQGTVFALPFYFAHSIDCNQSVARKQWVKPRSASAPKDAECNQVLPHSVTFDVTSIRLAGGYNIPPHVWPTKYYVELYKKGNVPIFYTDEKNIKNSFPKSPMLLKHSN